MRLDSVMLRNRANLDWTRCCVKEPLTNQIHDEKTHSKEHAKNSMVLKLSVPDSQSKVSKIYFTVFVADFLFIFSPFFWGGVGGWGGGIVSHTNPSRAGHF